MFIRNESESALYACVKSAEGAVLMEETRLEPLGEIAFDAQQRKLICITLRSAAGSGAEDYTPELKLEKTLSRIFSARSALYRLAAVTEYAIDTSAVGDRVSVQMGKSSVTDSCYVMWMQPTAHGRPAGALRHCAVPDSSAIGDEYRRDTRGLRRRVLSIALFLQGAFGSLIGAAVIIVLGIIFGAVTARDVLIAVISVLCIGGLVTMDYYINVGRGPVKKLCREKTLRKIITENESHA